MSSVIRRRRTVMRSSFAIPKRYKQRLNGVAIELHRKWKIHLVAPAGYHASLPRSGLVQSPLCRVPDYAEVLVDSVGSRRVEPALLGIILTPPKASSLPSGGLLDETSRTCGCHGIVSGWRRYFRDRVVARTRVSRNNADLPDRQLGIEGKDPREDDAPCWAPRGATAQMTSCWGFFEQPVTLTGLCRVTRSARERRCPKNNGLRWQETECSA
jgi:hypothetical protein